MEKKLSKKEYAQMMNERRRNLFALANSNMESAVSNPEQFRNLLRIHAMTGYSLTNSLLVASQCEHATVLKDVEHWKSEDIYIAKGEKGIQILEPKGEYTKKDGTKGTNYNIKHVFDVSQTNKAKEYKLPYYMERTMMYALTYNTDEKVTPVSESSDLPRPTCYDPKTNTIYVKDNQRQDNVITGLMRERAHAVLAKECLPDNEENFVAQCVQFMLASKYGYDSEKNFSVRCIDYFKAPGRIVRKELTNICNLFKTLDASISEGIRAQKKNREQAR